MLSKISNDEIYDYIVSLDKKLRKKVETSCKNDPDLQELLDISKEVFQGYESEDFQEDLISDEEAESILKSIVPTHAWKVKKVPFLQRLFENFIYWYEIFVNELMNLIPKKRALAFAAIKRKKRINYKKSYNGLFSKLFCFRKQINMHKYLGGIGLSLIFNKKDKDSFNVIIKLNDPFLSNVRISLSGNYIGVISEIINDECEFKNLPFDSYTLVLKQFAEFKGSYQFKLWDNGVSD